MVKSEPTDLLGSKQFSGSNTTQALGQCLLSLSFCCRVKKLRRASLRLRGHVEREAVVDEGPQAVSAELPGL